MCGTCLKMKAKSRVICFPTQTSWIICAKRRAFLSLKYAAQLFEFSLFFFVSHIDVSQHCFYRVFSRPTYDFETHETYSEVKIKMLKVVCLHASSPASQGGVLMQGLADRIWR